jgi:hypothetical protein
LGAYETEDGGVMPGYIKLYRDLTNNPLWVEKPYTRGQAWVDMLFRCNHVCIKMPPQYQGIWILRGQFLLSNLKLAETWGWDEKKVRRFMGYLEQEGMIRYFPRNKFCVYECVKYAELQATESDYLQTIHAEQKPSKRRTKAEQTPTNNNDNNDKELKELINTYAQDPKLNDTLNKFLDMRVSKKKTPTNYAMELIFKTLKPFDIETQIKMLEKSIVSQWTDVFPLKDKPQSGNPFL